MPTNSKDAKSKLSQLNALTLNTMGTCFIKTRILVAVMLVNFVQCINFYYGNLLPYMYSIYSRIQGDGDSGFDIDPTWSFGIYLISYILGTLSIDLVRKKIGFRSVGIVGIVVFDAGLLLTYWTVQHSVWATTVTFMLMGGVGTAYVEASLLLLLSGWFTEKLGLASSVAMTSNSVGGVVINFLITVFINSDQYKPDSRKEGITYFSQSGIIERVPKVFLLIGGLASAFHLVGYTLIKMPSDSFPSSSDKKCKETADDSPLDDDSSMNSDRHSYTSEIGTHPNDSDSGLLKSARNQHKNSSEQLPVVDLSPLQVLKTEMFYYVALAIVAEAMANVVVSNYFKIFGLLWIHDDAFFAFIGSSASMLTIVFQFGIGYLVDTVGVRTVLMGHLGTGSVLLCFWYLTAIVNRWLYFVCTNILLCLCASQFFMFPLVALKLFGPSFFPTNLGLLLITSLPVYIVSPPLISLILVRLGWYWMFVIVGSLFVAPLLLIAIRGSD